MRETICLNPSVFFFSFSCSWHATAAAAAAELCNVSLEVVCALLLFSQPVLWLSWYLFESLSCFVFLLLMMMLTGLV